MLDRVVEEVHHERTKKLLVAGDRPVVVRIASAARRERGGWRGEEHRRVTGRGERARGADTLAHQLVEVELLPLQRTLAGIGAREQEEIGDDPRQAPSLVA